MADEKETADGKPSGDKKLLIIGLAIGLLLGGGAGAGAFLFLGGQDAPKDEIAEVKPPEPKIDTHFAKIEGVVLPLFHDNRILGNVKVNFSLEVDGNKNKMLVVQNMPEIRDALLRHFSATAVGRTDNPRITDYPRLKAAMKNISNDILKAEIIRKVLIVEVQQF